MENKDINENAKEEIVQTKEQEENKTKQTKKPKLRKIVVICFIILFALFAYVQYRGSYLEYLELGENFIGVFYTNLAYQYAIMFINFIFLYFVMYLTGKGIKKGLKAFFEQEKKEMPKLPNKSIALVVAAICSVFFTSIMMQKIMLVISNSSFGMQDIIYNLDIGYYIFQKPVIEIFVCYFIALFAGLTIYMAIYYIVVFNIYFDGIDGKMLKQSIFMKKLTRNIFWIAVGIAILTLLNTQNIVFGKLLTVSGEVDLVGAGATEAIIKRWGYLIFSIIIVTFVYRAIRQFKEGNTNKVLKNLAVIPGYLVVMFVIMIAFDLIFVNGNELDKEKAYIESNIQSTKNAYNINIQEVNIENSGTITKEEIDNNQDIIDNIPVITQDAVLKTLEDTQTQTGYYSYRDANIANYKINGKNQLVYVSPREIKSSGRTYSNKTYEYTHGIGQIITSAVNATETGNVEYIQKDITGNDEAIKTSEPRMYFGLESTNTIATNTKNQQEYDYTDEEGNDHTSSYTGKAGLNLGFIDRVILGITKGDINLALSSEMTENSKILINRNIRERAKKALPYLIYDENPYTVVTDEGKIIWVLDAYTVSSSYPYSQYATIIHDGIRQDINYIRNSVKVLIDSYDGTISYYITDRSDPIAMAYRNIYPTLFKDLDEQVPEDISKHFVYPTYLYNVQAEILKTYHNVKPDVLYRGDDLWDVAKFSTVRNTKSTGIYMEPYYTMVKSGDSETLGLMQIYTPLEKQNLISYLVGTVKQNANELTLYKFSADSNMAGPMQLDNLIEQDEAISSELETLNVTGTKITKQMIIVPVNNTLIYIEPIYQTLLNESDIPILKKIVVASGNKVAIGNTTEQALQNLLSTYAVDIEVENTEDIEGLIDAIIKANKNLEQSNQNNDWEMMGKDVKRLQELISSLEELKEEEKKDNTQIENNISTNDTNNISTNINENVRKY